MTMKNRFVKAEREQTTTSRSSVYYDDDGDDDLTEHLLPRNDSAESTGQYHPTAQTESYYASLSTKASRFFSGLFFAISGVIPFLDFRDVTNEQINRLFPFRDYVQRSFTPEDPDHLKKLLLLWTRYNESLRTNVVLIDAEVNATSGDPVKSNQSAAEQQYISKKWSRVGFQGSDPNTDFRGGGVFSLINLLRFSECEPEVFRRLLRESEATADIPLGEGRYAMPVAISGINVCMMLLHMLQLTSAKTCFSTTQKTTATTRIARRHLTCFLLDAASQSESEEELIASLEDAFGRVFCYTFKLLDKMWQASPGNIMEFNSVLLQVCTLKGRLRAVKIVQEKKNIF